MASGSMRCTCSVLLNASLRRSVSTPSPAMTTANAHGRGGRHGQSELEDNMCTTHSARTQIPAWWMERVSDSAKNTCVRVDRRSIAAVASRVSHPEELDICHIKVQMEQIARGPHSRTLDSSWAHLLNVLRPSRQHLHFLHRLWMPFGTIGCLVLL